MVREIKWTLRALDDLRKIYDFIAKDSRRYARIQVENIQNTVSAINSFPLIGRVVPEFPNLSYREMLVGSYRLIYRFSEERKQVVIMAVVHGRQILRELPNS